MGNIYRSKIEKYIIDRTYSLGSLQTEMEKYALENHVPIISRDSLALLTNLVRIAQPKSILEFGTAIGYSSIMMSEALGGNVKITTIERNQPRYELALNNIRKSGYKNITVLNIDGTKAKEILENREFDLVFIDAAKGQYKLFFDMVYKMVPSGGIIVSDNIFHKGMVCEPVIENVERRQRTIFRRMNEYLDFLTSENPNFYTSLIPVGDGMAITYKK